MQLFLADRRSLPLVVAVTVMLAPLAGGAAPEQRRDVGGTELVASPPAGSLWDEDGAMKGSVPGAALRARLDGAVRRAGVPIAILILGRRAAVREPLAEIARRTFSERHLGVPGTSDAVLLVAAPAARQSVIETGKGDAGIVPEIDARAITAELQRHFGRSLAAAEVARALSDAADRIATSILATEERRRPIAEDERADDTMAAGLRPAVQPPGDGSAGRPAPAAVPRRSMLPAAAGLAIMLVLALGLRQRRRGQDGGRAKSAPPGPPRL